MENVTLVNPDNCSFGNQVHIKHLNGENFEDFLARIVDTRTGLSYAGALEFEHISTDRASTHSINDVEVEDLVSRSGDVQLEKPLTILGHMQVNHGATVKGHIQGLKNLAVLDNGTRN